MTNEQTLIDRGAMSVAGHLILRNQSMGIFLNGGFVISAEGLAELEVEEVQAREVKTPARPKKTKPVLGTAGTDSVDAASELDDLLGQ